jgi:hypothetical protein
MTIGLPTPSTPPRSSSRSAQSVVVLALMILVAGGAAAAWWLTARKPAPPAAPRSAAISDTAARAPVATRILVRVVNGTGVRGLARRATTVLRDFGYDVVEYDSERDATRATTQIVVHTGHREWATRVQRALGTGALEERPDSLRYVDLTVILGRDWQPPAEPFRP